LKSGVSYKNGETSAYIEPVVDADLTNFTFSLGSGEIKAAISPGFDFLLFNVLGPFISPYVYVKCGLDANMLAEEICVSGKLGAEFIFGVTLDIFSLLTLHADATAQVLEITFFDQCFDLVVPELDAFSEDDIVEDPGIDVFFDLPADFPDVDTVPGLNDDFSGSHEKWEPYGSPSPQWLDAMHGRNGVLDNNGDPSYSSGVLSRDLISCSSGCTIESDVYLELTDETGCWNSPSLGITKEPYAGGLGFANPEPLEWADGVFAAITYDGDACWGTPEEYRRHAYFWGGFYAEDETFEQMQSWSEPADSYVNDWHNLGIDIGSDRYVKFYVDGAILWESSKRIHPALLTGRNIYLGSRSSGSAGKSYHDFIRMNPK
jgi:hypothetical protein